MLAPPWPPAPGPSQPRDAHASAWANDVGPALARRRHGPPAPPVDVVASWGRSGVGRDGGQGAQERDVRQGDVPEQDPAPRPHRIPVRWEPQEGWIPAPTPAPEQRWTPEQDWVAVFGAERATSGEPPSPRPWRTSRRWVLALVATLPLALVTALAVVLT